MVVENPPFPPFNPSPPAQPEQPARKKPESRKKSAAEPAAEKPARQKQRSAGPKAAGKAPKFDLQTILAAASTLKEADMSLFEKMIGQLQDAGKPSRDRVLSAIAKVFG